MEGNASAYQVYLVSGITGEGGAEWGHGFEQVIAGGREGGTQNVRGNYKSFKRDKSDGFGKNAPVYHAYPVSRTTSEERAECSRGMRGGAAKGF